MNDDELRALYESVVRTSGHPDPMGYMARALVFSDADPDYIDIEGRMGFMPVTPDRAVAEVGASEVQSLQGNVTATLAMDILYFDQLQSIEGMIVAFHDGIDEVNQRRSDEMQELLENLPELREQMTEMVSPRLATVEDVIRIMTAKKSVPKRKLEAFKEVLSAVQ